MEVIEKYQGKQLSANLPYKTLFVIPKDEGKDQKLIAHLVSVKTAICVCKLSCIHAFPHHIILFHKLDPVIFVQASLRVTLCNSFALHGASYVSSLCQCQ